MPELKINFDSAIYQKVLEVAQKNNMPVEQLLNERINQRIFWLLDERPDQWIPMDEWENRLDGDDCPMCADLGKPDQVNDYGYPIAELSFSRFRLAMNQGVPGYAVLICNQHAVEPFYLSEEDSIRFFNDMRQAGGALFKALTREGLNPIKINYQLLGNEVPHMHVHIIPRFHGDAMPHRPLPANYHHETLPPEDYEQRVRLIREAL